MNDKTLEAECEVLALLCDADASRQNNDALLADWIYEEAQDLALSVFGLGSIHAALVLFCRFKMYLECKRYEAAKRCWVEFSNNMRW